MYTVPQGLLKHLHRTPNQNMKIDSDPAEGVFQPVTAKHVQRNFPETIFTQNNKLNLNVPPKVKHAMSPIPQCKLLSR